MSTMSTQQSTCFCCLDDLSYGLNTLGPLCLWQCLNPSLIGFEIIVRDIDLKLIHVEVLMFTGRALRPLVYVENGNLKSLLLFVRMCNVVVCFTGFWMGIVDGGDPCREASSIPGFCAR